MDTNRRTGRTTRQADDYIQELFKEGWIFVSDHAHHINNQTSKRLLKIIFDRLKLEHRELDFVVDPSRRILKLSFMNEYQKQSLQKFLTKNKIEAGRL